MLTNIHCVLNSNNPSSPLRLKLFHDVQKVVVNLRLTPELQLHLVQVGQGILHLRHNQRGVALLSYTCHKICIFFSFGCTDDV